jgi:nucleotide-binding universal stress UspA family protein
MKVKPSSKPGQVVVELGRRDESLLTPGFRLKRILVPLDFSECARKALQYAIPFAGMCDARLLLLHVVQLSYTAGELGPPEALLVDADASQGAEQRLRDLASQAVGHQAAWETVVRMGLPSDEIVQAAQDLNADLIILSTHGHTGLKHMLLGSVAEAVVRRAPCPVLTVRLHEHDVVPSL